MRYLVTYEVIVEVEAENEDEAWKIADETWWEEGQIVDSHIESEC